MLFIVTLLFNGRVKKRFKFNCEDAAYNCADKLETKYGFLPGYEIQV